MNSVCVIAKRDRAGFAMTIFANQPRSNHLLAAALDQIT